MSVTERKGYANSAYFVRIVEAIQNRERALGIYTTALREAYENGRADADAGAVGMQGALRALIQSMRDTSDDEMRVAWGNEALAILTRLGGAVDDERCSQMAYRTEPNTDEAVRRERRQCLAYWLGLIYARQSMNGSSR